MARRATRRAPCRRAVSWYVVGIAHSISHPGEISQVTPPVCAGESKWRRLEFVSKYSEYRCLRFVSKYSERVAVLPGHQRGGPPPSLGGLHRPFQRLHKLFQNRWRPGRAVWYSGGVGRRRRPRAARPAARAQEPPMSRTPAAETAAQTAARRAAEARIRDAEKPPENGRERAAAEARIRRAGAAAARAARPR